MEIEDMLTKIKLGLGTLVIAAALVGCGGAQLMAGDLTAAEDVESAKEDSARKCTHPDYFKCEVDADCVAIEQPSCCPHGYQVAVNGHEVKAYEEKFACTAPPRVCPLYVVNDTRVAQCDFTKHQCQMIDPTEIHCGGFIAPPRQHQCPTGFACHLGLIADTGGSCVASSETN
jgi:hypothetical protein